MPEKSKPGTKKPEQSENDQEVEPRERSYYYDDAHGYEDFDPEDDIDDEFED